MTYEEVENVSITVDGGDSTPFDDLEPWDRVSYYAALPDTTLSSQVEAAIGEMARCRRMGANGFRRLINTENLSTPGDVNAFEERLKRLKEEQEPLDVKPEPKRKRAEPKVFPYGHPKYVAPEPTPTPAPTPAPTPQPVQQASNTAPLAPDLEQTDLFFELLGKDRKTAAYRAFMHKTNPKKTQDKGRKHDGWSLTELNRWQREERSIYAVINSGGQKASEITTCIAFYCEWDGATRAEQLKELERMIGLGLPAPTFAVWTGGHDTASLHTYWRLDTPMDSVLHWRWIMWRLIEVADSDRAIEDPSRVMRVPGFHYIDGAGADLGIATIETTHCSGQPVTVEQMDDGLIGAERALFGEPISHLFIRDSDSSKRSRAIGFTNKPKEKQELLNLLSAVYEPEYAEAVAAAIKSQGGAQPSLPTPKPAPAAASPRCDAPQTERDEKVKGWLSPERAEQFEQEKAANAERSDALRALGWIKEHPSTWTVASIRAALACFPSREGAGSGTYTIYRDLLAAMRVALSQAKDIGDQNPTDLACELMTEHSPDGWDIAQVLGSYGTEWTDPHPFWWWTTEKGYRPEGDAWRTYVPEGNHGNRELRFLSDKWQLVVMVQSEANEADIQSFLATTDSQYRLREVYKAELKERERNLDAADVVDRLQKGQVGAADSDLDLSFELGQYFPGSLIDTMTVLRHGYGFNDHAIAMISVCGVAAAMPPEVRISTKSMSQPIVLWGGLVGTTGVSKSALLEACIEKPYLEGLAQWVNNQNELRGLNHRNACKANKEEGGNGKLPRPRKMSWLATPGGSAQGIQADLADHGGLLPKLMLADELTGLLEQISCPVVGQSDEPFWNSSYDQRFSSVTFADESKNRTVDRGKVSLAGGIQPKVLERLMKPDSISSGFWGRWLMASQTSLRKHLIDDPHPGEFNSAMSSIYMKLTPGAVKADELLPGMEGGGYRLRLNRDAAELFQRIFDHCETLRLEATTDGLEGLYAKSSAQVLRAAAPIQMMRYLWGIDSIPTWDEVRPQTAFFQDPNTIRVGPEALLAAYQLVMKGKQLSADAHLAVEDPMAAAASKLVSTTERLQAKAHGKPVSLRDVRRSMTGGKSKIKLSGDDLTALVRRMGNQGLLIWSEKEKTVAVPVHLALH